MTILGTKLSHYLNDRGIKYKHFAETLGISYQTLCRLARSKVHDLSAKTLILIESATMGEVKADDLIKNIGEKPDQNKNQDHPVDQFGRRHLSASNEEINRHKPPRRMNK